VTSFDAKTEKYSVRYADGSKDSLSWSQVAQHLMGDVAHPPMKVGTIFFKTFPGEARSEGVVVDFDAESHLHHVRYTDGDEEDLGMDEIYGYVMASTTKGLLDVLAAASTTTASVGRSRKAASTNPPLKRSRPRKAATSPPPKRSRPRKAASSPPPTNGTLEEAAATGRDTQVLETGIVQCPLDAEDGELQLRELALLALGQFRRVWSRDEAKCLRIISSTFWNVH
jgi:hypothetical protein